MKKYLSALGLSAAILLSSNFQASANESETIDVKTQKILEDNEIELGTVTYEEDGWDVEVTTKLGDINEFKTQAGNNSINLTQNNNTVSDIGPLASAKKDDWSGAATIDKDGIAGSVWTNKVRVSTVDTGPNSIVGDIMTYTKASGVTARPRLELSTWGLVGGSLGVIKEYKFSGSYDSGTVTKGINQSLTGIIALYYIDLYGDFKKSKNTQTAKAKLTKN